MHAEEVAPGVRRLGSALVGFHLVEDDGRLTLVDAGLPVHFAVLQAALDALELDLHAIEAVVLTHAHPDATGIAERVRTEAQARVHVHGADAQLARTAGGVRPYGALLRHLRRPAAWQYLWHLNRGGAGRTPRIEDVATFQDGTPLDVPGRLRPIPTPGHTHGHCALLLERGDGVLFAGDALCTRNPLTGSTGPQLMPAAFNASTDQAADSLQRLAHVDARLVLPAHGEPWDQGAHAAVQAARVAART